MWCYRAYGVSIHSELALPELLPHQSAADLVIRVCPIELSRRPDISTGEVVHADAEEAILFWPGVGRFWINREREIQVDPEPGVDAAALRLFILGPVLAAALRYLGLLALHASAVHFGGGATIFLADPGVGKSTLAAACLARGHAVLSDDIAAIQAEASRHMLLPGFPQLKLWPDAAAMLTREVESLPRLRPEITKRALRLDHGFQSSPLPVKRVFVLARGERAQIEPLTPTDGLIELIRHSYGARRLKDVEPGVQFQRCAALASDVPIGRLKLPPELEQLAEMVELLEADSAQPTSLARL